jgi:NADH:ubiquinone oxidoreductase subunit K
MLSVNFFEISDLLFIPLTLFFLAFWGLLIVRRNAIIVFMSIELMLLAVNFFFIVSSLALDDAMGLVYGLVILTMAAAESAIGLAILVVYYRLRGVIELESISVLKD